MTHIYILSALQGSQVLCYVPWADPKLLTEPTSKKSSKYNFVLHETKPLRGPPAARCSAKRENDRVLTPKQKAWIFQPWLVIVCLGGCACFSSWWLDYSCYWSSVGPEFQCVCLGLMNRQGASGQSKASALSQSESAAQQPPDQLTFTWAQQNPPALIMTRADKQKSANHGW